MGSYLMFSTVFGLIDFVLILFPLCSFWAYKFLGGAPISICQAFVCAVTCANQEKGGLGS